MTMMVYITPEQAKLRGGYNEERYEREEMQKRVREVFIDLELFVGGWGCEEAGGRGCGTDREVVAEDI